MLTGNHYGRATVLEGDHVFSSAGISIDPWNMMSDSFSQVLTSSVYVLALAMAALK